MILKGIMNKFKGILEFNEDDSKNKINGMGKYTENCEQEFIDLNGMVTVDESLECKKAKLDGIIKINNDLIAEEQIEQKGQLKVGNSIKAAVIELKGQATINNSIVGKNIKTDGTINVKKVLFDEKCNMKGLITTEQIKGEKNSTLQIQGRMSADKVEAGNVFINVRGKGSKAKIGTIIAGKLEITNESKTTELIIKKIGADKVFVEYAEVQSIKGRDIEIGAGCIVDMVQYSDSIKISPESAVKECKQVL
ncbi:MAG TPA: hypothetical protein DCP90_00015 [Clostridiales bacterium]|nr:MAG: hypothetical protein A2Y22_02670 [Clostridiales bacterium GWD2_32_59]HAN08979.1 hypothetical protein [Clostridiales bacterium]